MMDAVMASIFGSAITDSKEAVLLSQDDRARCALDGVGVNFRTAIIQESCLRAIFSAVIT
jgi:hypothetical protein